MELLTELVFKRSSICDSLEEIRKASHESGLVKMNETTLYIWPIEDLEAEIKPYENGKDLNPINDWKGPIYGIIFHLPLFRQLLTEVGVVHHTITPDVLDRPEARPGGGRRWGRSLSGARRERTHPLGGRAWRTVAA